MAKKSAKKAAKKAATPKSAKKKPAKRKRKTATPSPSRVPLHRIGRIPSFFMLYFPAGGLDASANNIILSPARATKFGVVWDLTPHKVSRDRKALLVKAMRSNEAVESNFLDDTLDLNVTVSNSGGPDIGTASISAYVTDETP